MRQAILAALALLLLPAAALGDACCGDDVACGATSVYSCETPIPNTTPPCSANHAICAGMSCVAFPTRTDTATATVTSTSTATATNTSTATVTSTSTVTPTSAAVSFGIDTFERAALNPGTGYGTGPTACTSGTCWGSGTGWLLGSDALSILNSSDLQDATTGASEGAVIWNGDFQPQADTNYACMQVSSTSGATDKNFQVCTGYLSGQDVVCCGGTLSGNTYNIWAAVNNSDLGNVQGPTAQTWDPGYYIGIERHTGSNFRCYVSTNGTSWTALGASDYTNTNVQNPGKAAVDLWGPSVNDVKPTIEVFEVGNGTLPTSRACGTPP